MSQSTCHGGVTVSLPLMEVLLYVIVYLSWRCYCISTFDGGVTVFLPFLEVLLYAVVYLSWRCYCMS